MQPVPIRAGYLPVHVGWEQQELKLICLYVLDMTLSVANPNCFADFLCHAGSLSSSDPHKFLGIGPL